MPTTSDMLVYLYHSAKAVSTGEITPEQHVEDLCYNFPGFRPRIPKPRSKLVQGTFSRPITTILSQFRVLVEHIE